jgi:HK97 family phage prohead protease
MPDVLRATVMCRAESRKGNKLGGYAAVFDQVTDLGWMGKEQISRGAFDEALNDATTDVRALWNHDPQFLLGRQTVGTLRLSTDSHGLEYEVDLPDTQYAKDLRVLAERGDLDGASFAFVPGEWEWNENSETRTHSRVSRLIDVSPVTFPAYDGASTEARSKVDGNRRRSQLIRARARVHLGRV